MKLQEVLKVIDFQPSKKKVICYAEAPGSFATYLTSTGASVHAYSLPNAIEFPKTVTFKYTY